MKPLSSIATRHDRGFTSSFTSISCKTGGLIGLPGGLAGWFRTLQQAAGRLCLELMNGWFVGYGRCQLIPVDDSTRYPATKHLRPWGHVVRI